MTASRHSVYFLHWRRRPPLLLNLDAWQISTHHQVEVFRRTGKPVFGDLAVLDDALLIVDPDAFDVLERLDRALQACIAGIFNPFPRCGTELGNSWGLHAFPLTR